MEIDNLIFRASSCFNLFSGSETETFKKYIIKCYREQKYRRYKEINSKYFEKGKKGEEDAITVLSLQLKKMLKKNSVRLKNNFVTGEPDVFIGESIECADEGFDTKVSWELDTFPTPNQKLTKQYEWQDIAYMYLTGAKKWSTIYVLLDMPTDMLMDMLYRESFNHPENETPVYRELEIINNFIYDKNKFNEIIEMRGLTPDCDKSEMIINNFVEIPISDRTKTYDDYRDESKF